MSRCTDLAQIVAILDLIFLDSRLNVDAAKEKLVNAAWLIKRL
jgi:hypothetical protein